MAVRHIITCEYPPQIGGVSQFTYLLASRLAENGDQLHVWAPSAVLTPESPVVEGVTLHRELGNFSRSHLARVSKKLDEFPAPRRLFVQWVPHGYGQSSLNINFCRWIDKRARLGDQIDIYVHEPFLRFRERSIKSKVAALIHRYMVWKLLREARNIFVSIPAWRSMLRWYAPTAAEFHWLPVPSLIPTVDDPARSASIRARFVPDPSTLIVGHFGTCGTLIADTLIPALAPVLSACDDAAALIIGKGSESCVQRFVTEFPALADRIHATGELTDEELSRHLAVCDLMLQPFPDGVSTRRSSAMAALAHRRPLVTTNGELSEKIWAESRAVILPPAGDVPRIASAAIRALQDETLRHRLASAGHRLYSDYFSWPVVVHRLHEIERQAQFRNVVTAEK